MVIRGSEKREAESKAISSTHSFSIAFVLISVKGELEPIPADFEQEAGDTGLVSSQMQGSQPFRLSFTLMYNPL